MEPVTRPCVRFRLPDGTLAELEHGDVIGRLWSAALPLDDPRISEAHCLLSLREATFWMLSLRRRLAVDGVPVTEVRLTPGLRVELADGLFLTVEELCLPERVLTLETRDLPPTVLPAVCSVRGLPRPAISGRYDPDAPCTIWSTGAGWRLRNRGEERDLTLGEQFEVEGVPFRIGSQALGTAGPDVTLVQGGVHAPLVIHADFDTVQLHREHEAPVVLNGVQARLVSELVAVSGPVHWSELARELWGRELSEAVLRKRFDITVLRTRARLREARVRADLIYADGKGNFQLMLRPGDRAEDRT